MTESVQQIQEGSMVRVEIPLGKRFRSLFSGNGWGPTLCLAVNVDSDDSVDVMDRFGECYCVNRQYVKKYLK